MNNLQGMAISMIYSSRLNFGLMELMIPEQGIVTK